jgi:hypothetical protein
MPNIGKADPVVRLRIQGFRRHWAFVIRHFPQLPRYVLYAQGEQSKGTW